MFSGNRNGRKNRITRRVSILSEHAFGQPLLFLYPRWFTASLARTQQDASSQIRDSAGQTAFPNPTQRPIHPRQHSGLQRRKQPVALPLREAAQVLLQKAQTTGLPTISSRKSILCDGHRLAQQSPSNLPDKQLPALAGTYVPKLPGTRSSSERQRSGGWFQAPEKVLSSDKHRPHFSEGCASNCRKEHIDRKPIVRRVSTSPCHNVSNDEPSDANKRMSKRQSMRRVHDPEYLDWTIPLKLLTESASTLAHPSGERLTVKEETVIELTGSENENGWVHNVRDGCQISVLEGRPMEETRTLLLNGSDRATDLAREFLLEMDRRTTKQPQIAGQELVVYRYVLSEEKPQVRNKAAWRADEVPFPTSWSVRTFADHVDTLVSMQVPRSIQRELYTDQETHNRVVADTLVKLFSDPVAGSFSSVRALNKALHFTSKHFEIRLASDLLFDRAKHLGLPMPISTFNILYEGYFEQNDLERFRSAWADMQRLGLQPNGMTWSTLLRVVKSEQARSIIIECMRRQGLSDTKGVKYQIINQFVSRDFARYASDEDGFEQFVAYMDERYHQDWLSSRCIDLLLSVCNDTKRWHFIPKIVDLATDRDVPLNTRNLTHLLRVFRSKGSLRDTIALLESHFAATIGRQSHLAIPIAFMTAWNKRCHNVCRVLWRYAAVKGIITHTMQDMVATSLMKNDVTPKQSHTKSWWNTAGKIIAGTNLNTAHFGEHFSSLQATMAGCHPMELLAQWTANDGTREEQLALAYVIIHRDLAAWKFFVPMKSSVLFDLLKQAYALDISWRIQGKCGPSTLPWMIDHAIDVPLVQWQNGPQPEQLDIAYAHMIVTRNPSMMDPDEERADRKWEENGGEQK